MKPEIFSYDYFYGYKEVKFLAIIKNGFVVDIASSHTKAGMISEKKMYFDKRYLEFGD